MRLAKDFFIGTAFVFLVLVWRAWFAFLSKEAQEKELEDRFGWMLGWMQ